MASFYKTFTLKMDILPLVIHLVLLDTYQSFFSNTPFDLSTIKSHRNLTCSNDFNSIETFTDCDYCVYEYFSNGTNSVISYDCLYLTNTYRLVTKRCSGFTDSSDIGYGVCSQLEFEYFDIDLLCICATDFCNQNFTACKQSVDTNPNLPSLPSPIALRNEKIQCNDTKLGLFDSTYYCVRDSTPYIDMNQCEEYVRNHTVLCMYLESGDSNYLTHIAIPDEDYEYVLAEQIYRMQQMDEKPNVKQFYNETQTNFYIQWNEQDEDLNSTMIYNRCFCLTDFCNINLSYCLQSSSSIRNRSKQLFDRMNNFLSGLVLLLLLLLMIQNELVII